MSCLLLRLSSFLSNVYKSNVKRHVADILSNKNLANIKAFIRLLSKTPAAEFILVTKVSRNPHFQELNVERYLKLTFPPNH